MFWNFLIESITLNFDESEENLRMVDMNIVISKTGTCSAGLRY